MMSKDIIGLSIFRLRKGRRNYMTESPPKLGGAIYCPIAECPR
jgi:hypothetical protein